MKVLYGVGKLTPRKIAWVDVTIPNGWGIVKEGDSMAGDKFLDATGSDWMEAGPDNSIRNYAETILIRRLDVEMKCPACGKRVDM